MMKLPLALAAACFMLAACMDYLASISGEAPCSEWEQTYGDCSK